MTTLHEFYGLGYVILWTNWFKKDELKYASDFTMFANLS